MLAGQLLRLSKNGQQDSEFTQLVVSKLFSHSLLVKFELYPLNEQFLADLEAQIRVYRPRDRLGTGIDKTQTHGLLLRDLSSTDQHTFVVEVKVFG
jgi:hypothetical protein